jgi:O-antigen/teichoic acid export membrane protein
MLHLGASAHSALLGYTISASAIFVSQIAFLYFTVYTRAKEYGGSVEKTKNPTPILWKSRFWAFSWPFSAWGIFTWLQQASDRWSLQIFATTHDVGSYAPIYQLGFAPISMASGVAMAVLAPIIYQRSGDASDPARAAGAATTIRLVAAVVFCLTLCGFAFLSISHRWLFSILVGEQFRMGSFLLPWMFLAGGTFATGQILSLKQMSDVQVKRLLAPKIATAVVGLALNVVGAALAGIVGVVFGMTASAMIYTAWMTYLSFRDRLPNGSQSDPASFGS